MILAIGIGVCVWAFLSVLANERARVARALEAAAADRATAAAAEAAAAAANRQEAQPIVR